MLGSFSSRRSASRSSGRVLVIASRRAALLLFGCVVLVIAASRTRAEPDGVGLILSKLPPQASATYKAIRMRAGKATGQVLPLTKTEVWSVPAEKVEAVKSAARVHGVEVDVLDADWNHVFRPPPADLQLTAQQEAMMQHAHAEKATTAIGIVAAAAPALVEYALTKDAAAKLPAKDAPKIVVTLSDKSLLTLTRTSVDIKPDMCIWRGAVDGTDMPATIMWWPRGKMAGRIQHRGHVYAFRHIGGEVYAIIETSEALMPEDHPPPSPRKNGAR
jgi:hypothetical protein